MLAVIADDAREQDRRDSSRQRCLLHGRLEFDSRKLSLNCNIRNLTATGARLQFGAAFALPYEFILVIESQNRTLRARLMWSIGIECGVMFV
jgi:hypothetical protein